MNEYNLFDTSLLDDKQISETEFKQELYDKLSNILKSEFSTNLAKQKIKKESSGLNFACPFCRDSATDNRKKRAHFILKGNWAGFFKCFNCGKFMKIPKFFQTFKTDLSLSALTYNQDHIVNSNLLSHNNMNNATTAMVLNKEEVLKYTIPLDTLINKLNLVYIDKQKRIAYPGYLYLLSRCQYNYDKFLYDPAGQYIVILNLVDSTNVLGCQIRDITGKKDIRYKTMTLSSIHKNILKDDIIVPDSVDRLSTVFNIFDVDLYKPVLVTEGPFDAFLLPNCIALSGANKSLPIDLPFYFVYDSDKTGNERAIERINQGYNVFMWELFKKDLGLPNKNPYITFNKDKWDINDVFIWIRDNNYKEKIYWSKYFSNNPLDILNI